MPQQVQSGTQQLKLTYMGKPFYGGVNTSVPETDIDINESNNIQNCILRNGEIRSRIPFQTIFPAPSDTSPTRAITSFVDINGVVHTVAITRFAIYQLSINWPDMLKRSVNPWLKIVGFPQVQPNAPYSYSVLQTNLIFSNGGTNVFKWNGLTNTIQEIDPLADGTQFGAFFIMELAAKIIVAYTIEKKNNVTDVFPYRIRWTTTGAQAISGPNQFDPSVFLGAGFNDELDVSDIITGIQPIGRTGYIYRANGITEMIPNANGTGFDFDHLWASDRGIGNVLPQTLAGYGPVNTFVASDDIYQISPSSFSPIGGKAFNSIASDIQDADGLIQAVMLPSFSRGYPYSVYWLSMTLGKSVKHWLYDMKEKSWTSWVTNNKIFTCKPKLVFIH